MRKLPLLVASLIGTAGVGVAASTVPTVASVAVEVVVDHAPKADARPTCGGSSGVINRRVWPQTFTTGCYTPWYSPSGYAQAYVYCTNTPGGPVRASYWGSPRWIPSGAGDSLHRVFVSARCSTWNPIAVGGNAATW